MCMEEYNSGSSKYVVYERIIWTWNRIYVETTRVKTKFRIGLSFFCLYSDFDLNILW